MIKVIGMLMVLYSAIIFFATLLGLSYPANNNQQTVEPAFSTVTIPTPEVGQLAPDILLPAPDGTLISLSSLRGKIVLLEFWASWCGPCRRESLYMVDLYHAYKEQGFTMYSVSLDHNRQAWVQAILSDGLTWENHVSDLKGWQSQAADLYGVSAIPATFLIDKNGIILASNPRGASLEMHVKKALRAKSKK